MNISISEMLVVLLIALVVIKPEQLPSVVLHVGRFIKSLRGLFARVKEDMQSYIELAEKNHEQKREQP